MGDAAADWARCAKHRRSIFLTSFFLGLSFGLKSFKVNGVLQKAVCWNFVLDSFGVGLGPLWPRRGAGVRPGAEQIQTRRGSRICFPVVPERSKNWSKTMEPTTRIRDLGCSLEGYREVKSNSLKSQILEGICFKIHWNFDWKKEAPRPSVDQMRPWRGQEN